MDLNVVNQRKIAITNINGQDTSTSAGGSLWSFGSSLNDSNFLRAIDWWLQGGQFRTDVQAVFGPISAWVTTAVTLMNTAFQNGRATEFGILNSTTFNEDISNWDTSNVTNMSSMFEGAASFTGNLGPGDISLWTTLNVTDMSSMFRGASSFNARLAGNGPPPLGAFSTTNVTNMSNMFRDATLFNNSQLPGIGTMTMQAWTVSVVTDMSSMFQGAISFNQALTNWDTSNVKDMSSMFKRCRFIQ